MNTNLAADEKLRHLLLQRIKQRLPELENYLAASEGAVEEGAYRFYHQSFKVYFFQAHIEHIVKLLREILPERPLNSWFESIISEGTGKTFDMTHNQAWLIHTGPILEALFHAQYFLKMMCKYGKTLETLPSPMPSGWAAILYLYDLR